MIFGLLQRYLLPISFSFFSPPWTNGIHERLEFLACAASKLVLYSWNHISQNIWCYCTQVHMHARTRAHTHTHTHTHTPHAQLTSEILSFFPDGENRKKNTLFWTQGRGGDPRNATDHFQIIWDLSSCIKRTSGGGMCSISWRLSGSLLWKQIWSLTSPPSPTPSAP